MTIAIVTNTRVLVDQRVSVGHLKYNSSKIVDFHHPEHTVWGVFAGDSDLPTILMTDFMKRPSGDECLVINGLDTRNTEGVIVVDGKPYTVFFERKGAVTTIAPLYIPPVHSETVLRWFGSGGPFMMAYLKEHRGNIEKAMALTAKHAPDCGGVIEERSLNYKK